MRKWFFFLLCVGVNVMAQRELADPYPGDQSRWDGVKTVSVAWGSTDVRYSRSVPAEGATKTLSLSAWRGERVNAQAVVVAPKEVVKVGVAVSDLRSGRNAISAANVKTFKVTYVMADNISRSDSALVADRLVECHEFGVDARTTRPVWFEIKVPQDAKAGKYTGKVTVTCDGRRTVLPLTVDVADRVLPEPKDWKFHLDLWQNPYAVARYFDVPLWSKEHFDRMRPVMKTLADAGQKVITCSIIERPWNGQTQDPFESMIGKMKTIGGEWKYNYEVFDRWVEFMMSMGIDEQIDCYTLVPWHYRFDYYDMASNSVKYVACHPGEKEYEDFILPFLKDFASHLKQKGWFSCTCIAMDERPTDQLRAAYDIVKRADPGYRLEGAFNYFPEVIDEIYDISVGISYMQTDYNIVKRRRAEGKPVTFYTCCSPERPNTFTFSPPAESSYIGWHAAAIGYDGYLRWAYNSWVKDPCVDSRFRTWASGDCFLVYPDGSSIRMQRLVEGIQAYEKVRTLRESGDDKVRAAVEETLKPFLPWDPGKDADVGKMVREAGRMLQR